MGTPKEITLQLISNPVLLKNLLRLLIIIGALLFFSVVFPLNLSDIVLFYLTGILIWTITEYFINRYVLHAFERKGLLKSIADYHKKHHMFPKNPEYLMMPNILIISISIIYSFIVWLFADLHFFPLMAGFLSGYFLFITIHTAVHYYRITPTTPFGYLWRNHILHHAKYPTKAYGISTPLWDLAFKSTPPNHDFLIINPDVLNYHCSTKKFEPVEVVDKETEKAFLSVPSSVYSNDPYWISPLESEIQTIFDPKKNSYFKNGVAKRWILIDNHGTVVGRIAAFLNFKKMYEGNKKIGGIGFFECINDKEAAFCLFDIASNWLKSYYQVQGIDGPVNFGENDKFWGLLVEGFGYPSYGMNYNPPYYKTFFEEYGFKSHYIQFTNNLSLKNPLPERFSKIASRVQNNPRYSFKHFNYKEKEKFIKDFVQIYNQAWESFKDFKPLDEDYVRRSLTEIKPLMEERFIWFAYVDNQPAGLLVGMPDVNELLKYLNGKLGIYDKLKLLTLRYIKGFSVARVVIMGIVPQYQRLGLESALILHAYSSGKKLPEYKHVQLAWVGDFNDKMIAIHKAMGAVPDKKHATYRIDL